MTHDHKVLLKWVSFMIAAGCFWGSLGLGLAAAIFCAMCWLTED